ncbi:MAG: [FeFe] hydrogenase H-cluster radical SAM maturase HydE [Spirochaetota bacterium]|jgi:biotin synthase|nr:[FeFe] hydrogenase H-cluster radical SAM maturase HydE [Spirochaetota bacterium]
MDAIEELHANRDLPDARLREIIEGDVCEPELFAKAAEVCGGYYGKDIYVRGLIEFTNYCKNNCYYCGIRRDNHNLERYRLGQDEILACCAEGYELGYRTFVLQGGEDAAVTDAMVCALVAEIKKLYPDCAVTLSLGERPRASYSAFRDAGADRYLLRHETANAAHYRALHPESMRLENRKRCLWDLKEIGYQVGSGFMVGSPYQTTECLIEDLRFLQDLQPDMIGVGPYIPHRDTPFRDHPGGDLRVCLRIIAILRLLFPSALIPATTALGTVDARGRELGIGAGANVIMPNLSPVHVRKHYALYDNKICVSEGAAECRACLESRVVPMGYRIVTDIGNRVHSPNS